jgi:predicted  nucleic acid-binding Zn-ribbon protein
VKASRNSLRVELAKTREELDATRAELARHCGEALRTTQHQAALHAELASRQSLIDELRTRLATAEARAELAAATAASPRHPRYNAEAAMEAGLAAQDWEAEGWAAAGSAEAAKTRQRR